MNEILEDMWDVVEQETDGPSLNPVLHERETKSRWRKVFRKHGLQFRKYLAVIHLGKGHFAIQSKSREGVMHLVERDDNGVLSCSCEDHLLNKNPDCNHVKLIKRLAGEHIF